MTETFTSGMFRLLSLLLLVIALTVSSETTEIIITNRQSVSILPQLGAYYYPWWGNPSNVHWPNNLRDLLETRQEPFLGEYFNQNATVVDQHLQWANEYGISQFVAAWFGPNRFGDRAIRDYLFPSPARGNVQIGILYEAPGRLQRDEDDNKIWFNETTDNTAQLLEDFEYLAQTYFDQEGYLTTSDNRPIVYLYLARSFRGEYADAIQQLRSFMLESYGYSIYLVADVVYWDRPDPTELRVFDAVTAYNMHGPSDYEGYPDDTGFLGDVTTQYEEYQQSANKEGAALIPGIMPAYNDRAVRLENDNYVIPHETSAALEGTGVYSTFRESLHMAQRLLETATVTSSGNTIMITSWNEWHEDTNIEPTRGTQVSSRRPELYTQGYNYDDYGFTLLDIVKEFRQSFLPPTTAPTSMAPSRNPSIAPTDSPTTVTPTSPSPSEQPVTALPSYTPSASGTEQPSTLLPTQRPSQAPSDSFITPAPSTQVVSTPIPTVMSSSSATTEEPTTSLPQVRLDFALCLHRVFSAHLPNQGTATTTAGCHSNNCPPFLDYGNNNIFSHTIPTETPSTPMMTTTTTTIATQFVSAKGTPRRPEMWISLNQGIWWCRKSSERV